MSDMVKKQAKMIIFPTTATVEAKSQNMIFLAYESITAITGHALPPAALVLFNCEKQNQPSFRSEEDSCSAATVSLQ